MKKIVSTLNLEKEKWLAYRKQGIGGSDAGAICGLNPFRTAIQVYQDKISDETEDIDNEAMRQGREFEDYVARRFAEATGKKVRKANAIFCDEKHPFMLADVDRMVVGENAGLECKTASPYMADKWEDDNIPLSYQIQCHHYMFVCNTDTWYIAVLIYGREFKYYKIERDEQVIADLIQIEQDFWMNHVKAQVLPDPDGSKTADQVIAEYFRESSSLNIPLTGFDKKLNRRQELLAVMERMEKECRKIEQELKLYLGTADEAENERYRITWKSVCSNRIDVKLLKEEHPEIYERYKKTIQSRRFTVKTVRQDSQSQVA